MKINELEKILNVSRANIRFYEKEGLLNPERKENGYREYDKSEVVVLKKIIIYRKLGISIQDIKEIFDGKLTLSDAINESISSINSELTELAVSAKLCREIKNQGIDNSSLDEEYYWNEINRIESTGEEFYNFAGLDINRFEKKECDMKYKVPLGLVSAALLIFTLVVGVSRYGLVLAEYGNGFFWWVIRTSSSSGNSSIVSCLCRFNYTFRNCTDNCLKERSNKWQKVLDFVCCWYCYFGCCNRHNNICVLRNSHF